MARNDNKKYLEEEFETYLISRDIPFAREVYIDENIGKKGLEKRRWKFDFVISPILIESDSDKLILDNSRSQILVEIQGGIYMRKSGHNTPDGITKHAEKENWASLLGHKIIKLTTIHFHERKSYIMDLLDVMSGHGDPDKLKMNYKKAVTKKRATKRRIKKK